MKSELKAQLPNSEKTSVSVVLKDFGAQHEWNDLRIAAAYASVAGLMHLLDILRASKKDSFSSRWLFGLDDYLTQPGVLRTCMSLPDSETRIASLHEQGIRFHPKLLMVSELNKSTLACVGSTNLTLGGIRDNCEAFAAFTTSRKKDAAALFKSFDDLWDVGEPATDDNVKLYEVEYSKRCRKGPRPKNRVKPCGSGVTSDRKKRASAILTTDSPVIDPALAKTCWIEVGNNTGKGHELEFKAEQALFFELSPSGSDGTKQFRTFVPSSGDATILPLRYQQNGMWRLQMNADVPEVAIGLRPRDSKTHRLLRSPFVAVFIRSTSSQTYFLRFIKETSGDYQELRQHSELTGTIGRTSARQYGWC